MIFCYRSPSNIHNKCHIVENNSIRYRGYPVKGMARDQAANSMKCIDV